MSELPNCGKCGCEFTYEDGKLIVCPECGYEWCSQLADEKTEISKTLVRDAYGNLLSDGDSVTIIKDLKVKGFSTPIKIGLKVKDIRIIDEVNGHNIEAKVPGFGMMMLKSEVVKKCYD
jgi:protein PhnA